MLTSEQIIEKFQLIPHPEGGFYKETYRSKNSIDDGCLKPHYNGKRNYSTSIYFLLTSDSFSAFHRVKQDEIWHFYYGYPITLHIISKDGIYSAVTIGNDLENDFTPQFVVKGGNWFAAEVTKQNGFGLVGCTVAPGFDFKDFELGKREILVKKFPQHKKLIERFTVYSP